MAPKDRSVYRLQPTKEEQDEEEPSSAEEEDEPEKQNSSDETEDNSPEEDEEEEDQQNVNNNIDQSPRQNGWVSEPDSENSPSDYKRQSSRKHSKKRKNQESDDSQDSMRVGKKSRTGEKKSGCITRLWSDEDEISLLNGMINFKNVKRVDPNADMGAFCSFIKGKLKIDFSKEQLRTKIRRLKKRFWNALKKGDNAVFSKPHEDMVFELSKKIWGENDENGKNDNVKPEDDNEIVQSVKDGNFWVKYPFLSKSFDNMVRHFPSLVTSVGGMSFMKERLSLIGDLKARKLDEKWKQLIVEETELDYKMLSLMTEQVRMALDR